jgi:hypothetical protein
MSPPARRRTLVVLLCLLAAPASAGHYDWFRPNAFDLEGGYVSGGGSPAWTTAFSFRSEAPMRLFGVGCEYRFIWGRDPLPSRVHQSVTFAELHPLFFFPMLSEEWWAVLPATFYLRASVGPAWVTRPEGTHRVLSLGYGAGVDVPLQDPSGDSGSSLWLGLGFLVTDLAEYESPRGTRVTAWSLRLGMHMGP